MPKYITKNVVFEPTDFEIISKLAAERGYGQRGFSIALRQVVREWQFYARLGGIGALPRPIGGAEVPVITTRRDGNGD